MYLTISALVCFGYLYITSAEDTIEYPDLSQCPVQVEPLGCFRDGNPRALPGYVFNSRDETISNFKGPNLDKHWRNFPRFLANFICRCAKMAVEEKRGSYIGIQYYAECWSGAENSDKALKEDDESYKKYGQENKMCVDSNYKDFDGEKSSCATFAGKASANFVYRIKPLATVPCPAFFKPIGCFRDNQNNPRPLKNYIMNERDISLANWNGHMIEWNNWEKYMPALICRCALKAKQMKHRFFGIQYYGECWAGDDENELVKDGEANASDCLVKLGMAPYGQSCPRVEATKSSCQPQMCVGVAKTNFVYELSQGPLGCSSNPCKDGEVCIPNGLNKYECVKKA